MAQYNSRQHAYTEGPNFQIWPVIAVGAGGLALGIYLSEILPAQNLFGKLTGLSVLIVALLTALKWQGWRSWQSGVKLVILTLFSVIIGWLRSEPSSVETTINFDTSKSHNIIAVVASDTVSKPSGLVCIAHIIAYQQDSITWKPVKGKAKIRVTLPVPTTESQSLPAIADTLVFTGYIRKAIAHQIPEGFDFGQYLTRQGIGWYIKLKPGSFSVVRNRDQGFVTVIQSLRNYFQVVCRESLPNGNISGLVLGLALGLRQGLDEDTRNAFSTSGTAHILSVSGMHTSVLYMVLLAIGPVIWGKARNRLIAWHILIAGLVWLYTAVSGFSPAAIRAATMTTVMMVGHVSGRQAGMLNSLLATSWLMLMMSPSLLWDVSFQLSVAGCLGIALLSKPLLSLWINCPAFMKPVWVSITTSTGSALFTMPLALYYFKTLPWWFMPANLFTSALSSLLTVLSLVLILLGKVPFVGWLIAQLTSLTAAATLAIVNLFASIPHAAASLELSVTAVIMIALVVLCLIQWLMFKQNWALKVLGFVPVVVVIALVASRHYAKPNEVVVWLQYGKVKVRATYSNRVYTLTEVTATDKIKVWPIDDGRLILVPKWNKRSHTQLEAIHLTPNDVIVSEQNIPAYAQLPVLKLVVTPYRAPSNLRGSVYILAQNPFLSL